MENIKIKCQKLWLDHKHSIIAAAAGLVVGIILF
jgi:hypothetical protein